MSIRLGGMGWVTPLGTGVSAVWTRLLAGDQAQAETLSGTLAGRSYPAFRVPPAALASAPVHPRLRRSSAISRFSVVAGLSALEDAGVRMDTQTSERTAIIFAISNGGVVYTKRFYHEIVESGAQAASPLLFPETVFNAPASHLAAILGITGATYTLVGDGAVSLLALQMAEDLLQNPELDRCLVVGAEEADWLLCDAFHRWRLLRNEPSLEVFSHPARGTVLSEGAGAIVVDRTGPIEIDQIDPGGNFRKQDEARAVVDGVFRRLNANEMDLVVASANGTFIDAAERAAIVSHCPNASVYAPKAALGESVGSGGIWQVICAAQALRGQQIPFGTNRREFRRTLVSTCGLNQQVAGLTLRWA